MVELLWCSQDEAPLWQPDLSSERASIGDPSMSQEDTLLQLKRLTVPTSRLKKNDNYSVKVKT